jgi:dihydropteroate synthase
VILKTRAKDLDLSRTCLMGVLNITPDSFSDGGFHYSTEAALARAEEMVEEGVDIIDVGGESTRPGAAPVPLNEELRRVVPLVKLLAQRFPHIPISVDTRKAEVARQCLEEGASLVNDISALGDPAMGETVCRHDVPIILMHMQGDPSTMQQNPNYQNVTNDVKSFLKDRVSLALKYGIKPDRILLDPGIGFGKTVPHTIDLLKNIPSLLELGYPLVIGASRKSFIGHLLAQDPTVPPHPVGERRVGTLSVHLWSAHAGASILRVHDVKATRQALLLWRSLSI